MKSQDYKQDAPRNDADVIEETLVTANNEVTDIEVSRIIPFKSHPFKVLDDDKMHELIDSIMLNGIITPVIVRPMGDGQYEMVSGHRRLFAAKQIGLEMVPAIVKEMTDDEAILAMVDANLQRDKILPSEKAFALRMKYEAMRRGAGRPSKDNTSQVGRNFQTDVILAQQVGESRNQVHRYMRITEVIPEIRDMVDNKAIGLTTAVEISYLNNKVQKWLYNYMIKKGYCTLNQLYVIRDHIKKNRTITQKALWELLDGNASDVEYDNIKKITISKSKLKEYFPANYTEEQIKKVIFELLDVWKMVNGLGIRHN